MILKNIFNNMDYLHDILYLSSKICQFLYYVYVPTISLIRRCFTPCLKFYTLIYTGQTENDPDSVTDSGFGFWIGLNDISSENSYQWEDGTTVSVYVTHGY